MTIPPEALAALAGLLGPVVEPIVRKVLEEQRAAKVDVYVEGDSMPPGFPDSKQGRRRFRDHCKRIPAARKSGSLWCCPVADFHEASRTRRRRRAKPLASTNAELGALADRILRDDGQRPTRKTG